MWANGSGLPGIHFHLNGKTISNNWFPGASGGAGSYETTKWRASFIPPEPTPGFSRILDVEPGSSSIAVLVGDFRRTTKEELESFYTSPNEKIPPGYTKISEKEFIRASLLHFPVQKDAAAIYPVYMLNAIPNSTITVNFQHGKNFKLTYGTPQVYMALASVEIHMGIQIANHKEIAGFKLNPWERGGLLVFFHKDGLQGLQKMFVNLHSIESLKIRSEMMQKTENQE